MALPHIETYGLRQTHRVLAKMVKAQGRALFCWFDSSTPDQWFNGSSNAKNDLEAGINHRGIHSCFISNSLCFIGVSVMDKPREFWIEGLDGTTDVQELYVWGEHPTYEAVGYESITHVIEKSAADKLAEALEMSNYHWMEGMDMHDVSRRRAWRVLIKTIQALKEYKGESQD